MSHEIILNLSDEVYAGLESHARDAARSPVELAEQSLTETFAPTKNTEQKSPTEVQKEAARARFRQLIGSVRLQKPVVVDNDELDAALVKEYGSCHEDV